MKRYLQRFARWLCRKTGAHTLNQDFGSIRTRHSTKEWHRDDLAEVLAEILQQESTNDWFGHYMVADRELKRIRNLMKSAYHTDKDLNRAIHMADLEKKNKKLGKQVREMQVKAERFNRLLYATGLIVNCTGCERGAPFNGDDLTEAKVKTVEEIAGRLRSWWENHTDRLEGASK